jgi:hypothetical protein
MLGPDASTSDPFGSDPFADPTATPDGGGTGTILVERPETADVEAGDHERLAHYVRKEKILESAVTGAPVIALCGKVWVPNRDPGRFPVCPECQEIFESMPPGDQPGEGDS